MSHCASDSLKQAVDVLDALQCGAVLTGPDGAILHANVVLSRLVGRDAQELLGARVRDLFHGEDARLVDQDLARGAEAQPDREASLLCGDDRRTPTLVSSRPLSREAPRDGPRVFTILDVSDRKQAEARFREQYEDVARLSDTVLEQALDLKHYSQTLEQRIEERTAELREANVDSVYMLAVASEARDADTGAHVMRIKDYTHALARETGMSEHEALDVGFSAILHDVGKIQVSDDILKKPGRLTPEERKEMEYHTIAGECILSGRKFFDHARHIARAHHENWDGSGYPDKKSGGDIPLAARVVHVVDVFDALTTKRVYKPAWSLEDAVAEIKRCKGAMFDPRLVDVFLYLLDTNAIQHIFALRDTRELDFEE